MRIKFLNKIVAIGLLIIFSSCSAQYYNNKSQGQRVHSTKKNYHSHIYKHNNNNTKYVCNGGKFQQKHMYIFW